MTLLLHLSDPHFGTEQLPVMQALETFTHALRPDLVVLSGDITQRARAREFVAAAAFVKRLAVPRVLAIPGNHDVPLFNPFARLFTPYAGFKRNFGDELEPTFETPDCLVLGVKSTRRYRHVDGHISARQVARVAGLLQAAAPTQLRIVVLHQPVAVPRQSEQNNVVHGHAAAVAAWSQAGADLILAGHIHLPFALPLHEVAPLPRPVWAVNAGTALSTRVRYEAGNSVNVIRTAEPAAAGRCNVEHWTFNRERALFEQASNLKLG
jgi:3',5'-cyclic AMP phosphodiesterase CpdA